MTASEMDRYWWPEHRLVHGYLCFEEPVEIQVATWTKEITEFALRSGYQPRSIFIDCHVSTGGFACGGFIELLAALRLPDAYGVVAPSLARLSSDSFTQQVLIHMVQLTDSQLLVSANINATARRRRCRLKRVLGHERLHTAVDGRERDRVTT